jgi:flagellar hook-length control protein FliK
MPFRPCKKGGDPLNASTIPTVAGAGHAVGNHSGASNALGSDPTFKSQLDDSMSTLAAAKLGTTTTTTSDAALVQRIQALFDGGTSASDVVSHLASSLATSVASALGITTDAAKAMLTKTFSAALVPSGANTGPPLTNSERASALVTRLRQIAELATRVTNGETGQPIRLIAGQSSDAEQAGATPAPTTESILRDALAALAGNASPAATVQAATTTTLAAGSARSSAVVDVALPTPIPAHDASATTPTAPGPRDHATDPVIVPDVTTPVMTASPMQNAVQGLAAGSTDGRTVATDPATVIAIGGQTPIGRMLARASLANPATPPSASATAANDASSTPTSASAPATAAVTPATVATAAGSVTPKALDAFLQAFGAALARDDAASSKDAAPATAAAVGASATTTSLAAFDATGSFVANLPHDATAVAPPTPASTMPQGQTVDPNAVMDQVLQGVSLRTSDGSSEVRLRLVPENLGDVSVKLVVTGGTVNATLTASSPDAQSALLGGQSQLARTLADAGLKLQSFTVALGTGAGSSGTGNGGNGSGTDARSRQAPTRRVGAIDATGDDADDSSLLAVPSIGPPIYTPSTALGSMNYLV